MTSNDVDLLRKGLTSEYFLASFLEKDPSGYRLGQIVQDTKGKPPNSKTLYPSLNQLLKTKYIVEKNEKYYPNLTKLINTIDSTRIRDWQESLDPDEKQVLIEMLQNREFFKVVSDEILRTIHDQPNRIHNIDALETIANKIGLLTAAIILYRTNTKQTNQESQEKFSPENDLKQINDEQQNFNMVWNEQFIPMMKEFAFERKLSTKTKQTQKQITKTYKDEKKKQKYSKKKTPIQKSPNMAVISEAILIFLKSMPSLRLFLFVPEKTLWKLCKLWEGYGMFEFVTKFNQAFENQNKNSQ